ncbi:MAG TPA: response regulator transcription factor [Dehalococcoidia bacterium]|nr:response regulator transcription factor [Dehalococcoidia bacterium]
MIEVVEMGRGKIRVIIAEDHAFVREATRQLLEQEPDIEVVGEATNGAEAVSLVERLSPDVAIVDISMPVMSGLEATTRIKNSRPSTAVLILTQYADDQYVFALLSAGAAGYLLKDVPSAEVVRAVRSVYAGEPVLHPAIVRKVLARLAKEEEQPRLQRHGEGVLTERERDILRLAASGMSNAGIAARLYISQRTVQAHLSNIFAKLGVGSRTEAVIVSLRRGLIDLQDL